MILEPKSTACSRCHSSLSLILVLLHSRVHYIRIRSVCSFISELYVLRHELSLFLNLLLFRYPMGLETAVLFFLKRQVRHLLGIDASL